MNCPHVASLGLPRPYLPPCYAQGKEKFSCRVRVSHQSD